jgi:hypothetical protein
MKKNYLCIQLFTFRDTKTGRPFTRNFLLRVDADSKEEAVGKFVEYIQEKTFDATNRGVLDCVLITDITLIP